MAKMDEGEMRKAIRRAEPEHRLKADCLSTVSERATRYLELDFIKVTPNEYFSPISAECILLYRDGYFFACIALCQAVAEAIVRFLGKKNVCKASDDFNKSILLLSRRRIITPDCYKCLKEIWKDRNDYHHLNPKVPTERTKLQAIAKSKITALHNVESQVFVFEWVGGGIKPKYPKYWPENRNGLLSAFLRFEP